MKVRKYLDLVLILVIIIASIGTFYIQSAAAMKQLPQLTLKKISGDESEVSSLVINGNYENDENGRYEDFEMKQDKLTYSKQASIFERFSFDNYSSRQIAKIMKEERNFMRGKLHSGETIQRDDLIINTKIKYYYDESIKNELVISSLNKKTREKTNFTHLIKSADKSGWVDILKVVLEENELKILLKHEVYKAGSESYKYYLYSYDLDKEELVGEEELLTTDVELEDSDYVSNYFHVWALEEVGINDEKILALVQDRSTQTLDENYEIIAETGQRELLLYNFETKEEVSLDLDAMAEFGEASFYDNEFVYFVNYNVEKNLEISQYDIKAEKIVDTFKIEQAPNFDGVMVYIDDGKLYTLNTSKDFKTAAWLNIVDLASQKSLYQGEITAKNLKEKEHFYLHSLGFK